MKPSEFKKLVRESVKKAVNESMNLYVKGANTRRYDTLGELSHQVQAPMWHFLSTLPQDQQEYWKKNHRFPTYEIFTPDGPYYDQPTGIMNFYISGLTRQALTGLLKVIFGKLKQLGMSWGKIKREKSGVYDSEVIRIPIDKNPHAGQYRGPIELNMSNRNAYHIFKNILQYEPDDVHASSFSFKAKELMERIETLAHDEGWIDKHAIKPTDSDWPEAEYDKQDFDNPNDAIVQQIGGALGGARMISGGLSGKDIRKRLRTIWKIAKWAVDNGFEELYAT